jgi:hypothetical protein
MLVIDMCIAAGGKISQAMQKTMAFTIGTGTRSCISKGKSLAISLSKE